VSVDDELQLAEHSERLKLLGILHYPELAKRLREGRRLRKEERLFLADLVEGKIKRPAHRPPMASAALRKNYMAEWFIWIKASCPDLRRGKSHTLLRRNSVSALTMFVERCAPSARRCENILRMRLRITVQAWPKNRNGSKGLPSQSF
jgi:hypothetical protein